MSGGARFDGTYPNTGMTQRSAQLLCKEDTQICEGNTGDGKNTARTSGSVRCVSKRWQSREVVQTPGKVLAVPAQLYDLAQKPHGWPGQKNNEIEESRMGSALPPGYHPN